MMRVAAREVGSVVVPASREVVMDTLRRSVEGAAQTAPDRLRAPASTYVLREAPGGTQIILARRESIPALRQARRDELRRMVESDLFRLQRLFEVQSRATS